MTRSHKHFRLPPLKAVQAFEVSARLESFKTAADELHVTPAAVSHQIRILEEHLGVRLFERERNGITLTEEGKTIYPNILAAFELLHESVAALHAKSQEKTIGLTAGPAFTSKWLAPHLYNFKTHHPDISIEMQASLDIYDFRKSGIDIAIRFGLPTINENITCIPLVEDAVVPVVSPEFIERRGGRLLLQDIKECELIHDRSLSMVKSGTPDWRTWFESVGIRNIDTNNGLFFNHADHAIQAAIDGAGIALVRVILATRDIKSGRLKIPFGPIIPCGLTFSALIRQNAPNQAEIDLFLAWLIDVMKNDVLDVSNLDGGDAIAELLRI